MRIISLLFVSEVLFISVEVVLVLVELMVKLSWLGKVKTRPVARGHGSVSLYSKTENFDTLWDSLLLV